MKTEQPLAEITIGCLTVSTWRPEIKSPRGKHIGWSDNSAGISICHSQLDELVFFSKILEPKFGSNVGSEFDRLMATFNSAFPLVELQKKYEMWDKIFKDMPKFDMITSTVITVLMSLTKHKVSV